MKDLLSSDTFVEALNNTGVEDKVEEKEPATLRQALTNVMKLEDLHTRRKRRRRLGKF